jgi:hypothetical protein
MEKPVFISHSAHDKAAADSACTALETAGIPCWIAPRDVIPGTSYPEEIIRGIEGSAIVLFIFTGHSNVSRAVQKELERGVNRGKVIVPFRLEEVAPSPAVDYLIANEHWLDATRTPLDESLQQLVSAVRKLLARTSAQTAIPEIAEPPAAKPRPVAPKPKPAPRWLKPALLALLLLIVIAGSVFVYRIYTAARTPQLLSPADHASLIGSDAAPNLLLEFSLPEKPDRTALIQIQPEGEAPRPPVAWASSTYLVTDAEGPLRWRVQATWKAPSGQVEHGPWSPWRDVTYYRSRLRKILLTGRCLVGTADISPTDKMVNYDSATLQPGGYEIELLRAFFAAQDPPPPRPVTISFQSQKEGWGDKFFHMLASEPAIDMLVSGITPTTQREKDWGVRFSKPSFKFHQALLVRKGEPAITNGEIVAQVVGAAGNTTNADFLRRLFGENSPRAYIDPGPKYYYSLIGALQSRRIDAFLVDEVYLPTLRKAFPTLDEQTSLTLLRPEENPRFELSGAAYALRPEDREFREALDRFLTENPGRRKEVQTKFFPGLEFVP